MKAIDTDLVRQKWQYKPEFTTADTSSFNNLSANNYITSKVVTTASSSVIADEIQKKLDQMCKEREMDKMTYKGEPVVNISPGAREAHVRFMDNLVSIIRPKAMGITHESLTDGATIEIQCDAIQTCKLYDTYDVRFYNQRPLPPAPATPRKPVPKKVIFSGPATTILWKDGTKTTVKCQDEDVWDDDVGIAMCYLKKMLGNKGNYNNIFREAMKVAEVQTKKEELTSSTTIEGDSYYSSALDSMKRNIDEINDFMKDAAKALDKALGGKK